MQYNLNTPIVLLLVLSKLLLLSKPPKLFLHRKQLSTAQVINMTTEYSVSQNAIFHPVNAPQSFIHSPPWYQ